MKKRKKKKLKLAQTLTVDECCAGIIKFCVRSEVIYWQTCYKNRYSYFETQVESAGSQAHKLQLLLLFMDIYGLDHHIFINKGRVLPYCTQQATMSKLHQTQSFQSFNQSKMFGKLQKQKHCHCVHRCTSTLLLYHFHCMAIKCPQQRLRFAIVMTKFRYSTSFTMQMKSVLVSTTPTI